MTIGEPFNPRGLFNGIWIPEALLKAKSLSLGAKVVYGRLQRYAGENGLCYPAMDTLASEIGLEIRQTRRYISELEEFGLIRRVKRFHEEHHAQTSNVYQFLGHVIFVDSFKVTGGPRSNTTYPPRSDTTYKESHVEASHDLKNSSRARDDNYEDENWAANLEEPEPPQRMAASEKPITPASPVDDYEAQMTRKYGTPEWRSARIREEAEEARKYREAHKLGEYAEAKLARPRVIRYEPTEEPPPGWEERLEQGKREIAAYEAQKQA